MRPSPKFCGGCQSRTSKLQRGVCKRWHSVLVGSTYSVYDKLVFPFASNLDGPDFTKFIRFCDWIGSRSGSISILTIKGDSSATDTTTPHEELLLQDLAYLAGQLAAGSTVLELEFTGAYSILRLECFQEVSFLQQLRPLLTAIRLTGLRRRLSEQDMAVLGQLSRLPELQLCVYWAAEGAPGVHGDLGITAQLTSLTLQHHFHLTSLPAQLGHLQQLSVQNCPLLRLRAEVLLAASQLRTLELGYCGITVATLAGMSDSWAALRQLTYISIDNSNQITLLPPGFAQLPALRSLSMSEASFTTDTWMPACYSLLTSLSSLTLVDCEVQDVPDVLCNMRTLTDLDLSCNKLRSLPPNMTRLADLQELDLAGNYFASVPDVLSSCTSLRGIDLSQNTTMQVTKPLDGLLLLPHLRRLDLQQDEPLDRASRFFIGQAVARVSQARRRPALNIAWR